MGVNAPARTVSLSLRTLLKLDMHFIFTLKSQLCHQRGLDPVEGTSFHKVVNSGLDF